MIFEEKWKTYSIWFSKCKKLNIWIFSKYYFKKKVLLLCYALSDAEIIQPEN